MRRARLTEPVPSLAVNIGALHLQNPVLVASGPFGYGEEWVGLAPWHELGGLVLKTITLRPRAGNPPNARCTETPAGMLNSIGLENVGLEAFLADKLPAARKLGSPIIASIGGETIEEFVTLASRMDKAKGIVALEVNISCPNVHAGGMAFGVDPIAAAEVVRAVKGATSLPVIPKLTPNVTDIAGIARACEAAGADAISLINTFSAMAIDIRRRRPLLAANTGGLSGAAIRPAAVLRTYQVSQAVSIPVIGMGGIMSAADALEFIIAGATAVQIGTALFIDPLAAHKVLAGMREFLISERLNSITDLIGSLVLNK
jgi:dihydroorotate dehydrogenase (NAD+) catalytic subunit